MPIAYDGKIYEDEFALETGNHIPEEATQKPQESSTGRPRVYITGEPETSVRPSVGATEGTQDVVYPTPDYLNPPVRETPFPRPKITDIVSGIVKSAKEAFLAPGEAYNGELPMWAVDPVTGETNTSTQAIEKANDLASLAVLGPAPVAKKLADGTLGSFAGVKAKTLDKTKLYEAQTMLLDGHHVDDVYSKTGYYKSADGRWRHEIDDSKSNLSSKGLQENKVDSDTGWTIVGGEDTVSIKPPAFSLENFDKTGDGFKSRVLSEVLDHPELYKAYPHLKDIEVHGRAPGDGTLGSFSPDTNVISMTPQPADKFHSTLMHEVQHAIQQHEGFVNGANPKQFMSSHIGIAEKQLATVAKDIEPIIMKNLGFNDSSQLNYLKYLAKEKLRGNKLSEANTAVYNNFKDNFPEDWKRIENLAQSEHLIQQHRDEAYEMYRRVMGEVEARNVQLRIDLSKNERMLRPPSQTQDTPNFRQVDPNVEHYIKQSEFSSVSEPKFVGKLPEKGVVPANIGPDGRIYLGEPNTGHFELSSKYGESIRKENNLAPGDYTWKDVGFVNPEGKFMTREEAFKYVTENEKKFRPSDNMQNELDALDYRDKVPMKFRK